MPFPEYITTRVITAGGSRTLEGGRPLRTVLSVRSTRSLIWRATGYRFESVAESTDGASAVAGAEAALALPITDIAGTMWKDLVTGQVIDNGSAGDAHSHQYLGTVSYLNEDGSSSGIPSRTIGPFVLPGGDGPIDLDQTVPAGTVSGQVINLPDLWTGLLEAAERATSAAEAALVNSATFVDVTTAAKIADPTSATGAAVASSFAPLATALEAVEFYGYGHSFVEAAPFVDPGTSWLDRIATRYRTRPYINRGVGGSKMPEILARIESTWTPGSRGLIGMMCVLNDLSYTATGAPTSSEAFRSALAFLSASAYDSSGGTSTQYGGGWTNGVGSPGAWADVAWTGDSAWLRFRATTDASQVEIRSAGVVVATVDTGGAAVRFNKSIKLSGFGTGTHTVRITVTSGSPSLSGVLIPSDAPPLVVWHREPPSPNRSAGNQALLDDVFLPAFDAVAATFPNVIVATADPAIWSNSGAGKYGPGNHPNDAGSVALAAGVEKVLRGVGMRQGLNVLTRTIDLPTYTPPSPAYTSPSATTPGAPTGFVAAPGNQVSFAWSMPSSDGGATVTAFDIETALAGSGSWSKVATVPSSARSAVISAGLTPVSRDFRIRAVNAVGAGAPSATSTATPGASLTTQASDGFVGESGATLAGRVMPVGGYVWDVPSGSAVAITAAGASVTSSGSSDYRVPATFDDGLAQFTARMVLSQAPASSQSIGIVFGLGAIGSNTGYAFYAAGGVGYRLRRRNSAPSWTSLVDINDVVPAGGDELEVIRSGSRIVCKVNGVIVADVTDSTFTGTRKGITTVTTSPLAARVRSVTTFVEHAS